ACTRSARKRARRSSHSMSNSERIPVEAVPQDGSSSDQMAVKESHMFGTGQDLERAADAAQHGRRESARNVIGVLVNFGLIIAFLLLVWTAVTWAVHMLLPDWARYLAPAEVQKIQENLSHVVIGIFAG